MKQIELARELNVSKAYISMVLSGKKKPSKRVAEKLREVNLVVNSEAMDGTSNPLMGALRYPWWVRPPFAPASDLPNPE